MEAWQNISERDGIETATSEVESSPCFSFQNKTAIFLFISFFIQPSFMPELIQLIFYCAEQDVTRSEIVPPSPVFASRAVDQSRNMKEPPSDVVKPNRLPEMIQARQVPQNRVFSLKRGRACAPKDPRPCPSKHAAGASPAREEDSQPGVASSPLQMIQKLHPHQQACAEDFGSPSSDHLSSSIGLFTMLSNNPQRSRAVDAQPRQPSIDKDAVQHRPTKRLRQMASQDIQKATRCDVQVQTRKSEAPKGKEGKQVQARTPYNFRSREGGPRLQWRYSPGNDGHSSQQKKTAEKDDGKKRGSRPGEPCDDLNLCESTQLQISSAI